MFDSGPVGDSWAGELRTKAPLFEQALVGTVLKGLGGLPVYRRKDNPELMHLNDLSLDAAIRALQAGGAVQIYPEGQSHSEPSMTPLSSVLGFGTTNYSAMMMWRMKKSGLCRMSGWNVMHFCCHYRVIVRVITKNMH